LPGTDTAAIAGLTAVDKLASMFVTLLAGLAGCALYAHRLGMWSDPLVAGVALGGALLLFGAATVVFSRNRAAVHPARRTRFGAAWARAREAARAIPTRTLVVLLVLSVAFYLVFIAQFVLLLQAMGGGATLGICAGAATVMFLKTVIPPLTFGELGIREGVAVFVFAPLGFRAGAAFDASLLLFALNVLLPAIAGACVLIVFHGRRRTLP
jgi:uncharacterized membrane protein YbhN (UPF0104 family)